MSMYTVENFLDDYRERDPDEILDLLQINTEDLLDRFEERVLNYIEQENLEGEDDNASEDV